MPEKPPSWSRWVEETAPMRMLKAISPGLTFVGIAIAVFLFW